MVLIDDFLPTNSGMKHLGSITTSRKGMIGSFAIDVSVLANDIYCLRR